MANYMPFPVPPWFGGACSVKKKKRRKKRAQPVYHSLLARTGMKKAHGFIYTKAGR
jgi:hypothetical protein